MSGKPKLAKSSSIVAHKMRPSRYVISTPADEPAACGESRLLQPTQLDMFANRVEVGILPRSSRSRTGRTGSGRASSSRTISERSAIEQRRKALLSAINGSSN